MHFLFYPVLYALYYGLFILAINRWRFFKIEPVSRTRLSIFFTLKAGAGLLLTLVYTYYYTDQCKSDIYHYFNDSKIISSVLFSNPRVWLKLITGIGAMDRETFSYIQDTWYFLSPPGENITSNGLLIRITSLLNYFSGYNIYITTLLLNFISFIGITLLLKALLPFFKGAGFALCIPVYLLPSVLFWSSGILKEALLLPALGAFIFAWFKLTRSTGLTPFLLLAAALFCIAAAKIYGAALLLLCFPFLFLATYKRAEANRFRYFMAAGYVVMLIAALYTGGDKVCAEVVARRNAFVQLSLAENAGSLLDKSLLSATNTNYYELLTSSLINAMLRPYLWEHGNIFQRLFALENMVFIFAVMLLPVFFFKPPDEHRAWLVLFFVLFAMLNYLAIGLTIPVLGAIVHYRVVAMPFLMLAAFLLTDFEKLQRVLQKFNPRHSKSS